MRRTCLVTGGAGFIGSQLVDRLLNEGLRVVVLDNESTGLRSNVHRDATYLRGDVTNRDDLETAFSQGIDSVFHVAGQASTIRSFGNPNEDLNTNVTGTLNVLTSCINHKVTRLLFASSMTVYGDITTVPVPVSEPCRPFSYYGITKYAAERYVLATGQRSDLDFPFHATAFRMFNVYGERQRIDNPYQGVMGYFIGNVLRREPIVIHGDGEQTRDFIYIEDVVNGWMAALDDSRSYGKVFNLGRGEGISINELANSVIRAFSLDDSIYPKTYAPLRPGDQRHMVADIIQTTSSLDWSPKVSLEEGIKRTVAWASIS